MKLGLRFLGLFYRIAPTRRPVLAGQSAKVNNTENPSVSPAFTAFVFALVLPRSPPLPPPPPTFSPAAINLQGQKSQSVHSPKQPFQLLQQLV